jgi:hypothetical protein
MRWWVVWILVGCGDNLVDESVDIRSGSQLKLSWFDYPDAARELARHKLPFDTHLQSPCSSIEWLDGVERCTPVRHRVFEPPTYATGVFTDDLCTQLVARSDGTHDYVLVGETRDGRYLPEQMFRQAAGRSPAPAYYERLGRECVGPVEVLPFSLYEVGALVPTSSLVTVERSVLPSTGRLAHIVLDAGDGLQMWLGYHDRELGVDCSMSSVGSTLACVPSVAPDPVIADGLATIVLDVERVAGRRLGDHVAVAGAQRAAFGLFDTETRAACSALVDPFEERCSPYASAAVEDVFAESTCETPLRIAQRALDPNPFGADYAVHGLDYFEIGAPVAEAFTHVNNACVPVFVNPGHALHAVGALPRDRFPAATLVMDR